METIDLARLRKDASLTQEQVAEALNLSQSQVSRYESDPEEVSQKIVNAWARLCGDVQKTAGIKLDSNKRPALESALEELYGWFKYAPDVSGSDLPNLPQLLESIKVIGRKPRIVFAGAFDAGKSTLINFLIGGKNLPTAFQPTTSLLCQIKHISDKPEWQIEPAALFKAGYDINAPHNKENFEENKLFVGDVSILQKYAQHADRLSPDERPVVPIADAMYAVIYLDSQILTAIDIIDLPGYGNDENDTQKAEFAENFIDALVYLSGHTGFLEKGETAYLPTLIDKLPPVVVDGKAAPLANLFILATHIHGITGTSSHRKDTVENTLDAAAKRTWPALEGALKTAAMKISTTENSFVPSEQILRSRMFGFSIDPNVSEIRENFIADFSHYVGDLIPHVTLANIVNVLTVSKEKQITAITALTENLKKTLTDHKAAESKISEMYANRQAFQDATHSHGKSLELKISHYLEKSLTAARSNYSYFFNQDYIEKTIRTCYPDKKDAQKYVPGIIADRYKRKVDEEVCEISKEFNDEINKSLQALSSQVGTSSSILGFDVKTAFLSGLTGAGAAGALAGWAAIVAGGSNLGGYILAAKIVGWLSTIGISVSTTTVMTTIAALGGPLTIAIGIGAGLAALAFSIFGASWEVRLAKKLAEQFKKQKVLENFEESIKKYWSDTTAALHQSLNATIAAYDQSIAENFEILNLNPEDLQKKIDQAEQVKAYINLQPSLADKAL